MSKNILFKWKIHIYIYIEYQSNNPEFLQEQTPENSYSFKGQVFMY